MAPRLIRVYGNELCGQYYFADRTATDEERLNKASLPSLANKGLQEILILMYKVNHSLAPEHISNMFYKQDKHNLPSDLPVPRYGTVKYGKHSIRYVGPYFGGKISQDIRSKTSLRAFVGTVRNGVCILSHIASFIVCIYIFLNCI